MSEAPERATLKDKRRRNRNIAIFAALVVFVVLVYGVTIVKITKGYGP